MKNILLIFCLLFLSFGFSQNKKCTIYFKDNTTLVGLGKIKSDELKFRVDKNSESEFIDANLIDKVYIESGDENVTYQYNKIIEKDNYEWMKLEIKGTINLYTIIRSGYAVGPPTMGMGGGMMNTGGYSYSVSNYYINREGENGVTKITSIGGFSKNFKKAASEYFKDCPKLVELIQTKYYKKNEIEDIVRYYNTNCGVK